MDQTIVRHMEGGPNLKFTSSFKTHQFVSILKYVVCFQLILLYYLKVKQSESGAHPVLPEKVCLHVYRVFINKLKYHIDILT